MRNNQKQQTTTCINDIHALSASWKASATPQELADMMHTSKSTALRTIVRLRAQHGTDMFPHRKKAVAEGGYSKKKVLQISSMWKKRVPLQELADKSGLHTVDSVWGTIALLRKKYGEELFPRRK